MHIIEPGLDRIVASVVRLEQLRASLQIEEADAFIIAVPTPFDAEKRPDLSYVQAATLNVAPHLRAGNLVVLESTSPVGTTEQMCEWLAVARPDLTFPHTAGEQSDIQVAYCPERVLPGRIVEELRTNPRVLGGISPACAERARELYRYMVPRELCHLTTARTAELSKLVENAYRDVNIAFANELSLICERLNVPVWDLIQLANKHPRVNILKPGCGVGGHCIAVDPFFIVQRGPEEAQLIRATRLVNTQKTLYVIQQIQTQLQKLSLNQKRLGLFGLTFKPDIDDLRESPALAIADHFSGADGVHLSVIEPHVEQLPACLNKPGVSLHANAESLELDCAVFLVKHSAFLGCSDRFPVILDFAGV